VVDADRPNQQYRSVGVHGVVDADGTRHYYDP